MAFLMAGEALWIFCSAWAVREMVSTEAALPFSWAVHVSWPVFISLLSGCAKIKCLLGGNEGGLHRTQSISDSGDNMALYRPLSPVGLRRNSISEGKFLRQVRRFVASCLQSRWRELDLGMRSHRLSAKWTLMESNSLI